MPKLLKNSSNSGVGIKLTWNHIKNKNRYLTRLIQSFKMHTWYSHTDKNVVDLQLTFFLNSSNINLWETLYHN